MTIWWILTNMATLQIKEMTDEQRADKLDEFLLASLESKDDYVFDFEADLIRIIKRLDVKRLMRNDRKYIRGFTNTVVAMFKRIYVPEVMRAGIKDANNFKRLYTEPING